MRRPRWWCPDTLEPVQNQRVILGRLDGKFEQTAEANPASYMDGKSGKVA